jgi:hypothetical protein
MNKQVTIERDRTRAHDEGPSTRLVASDGTTTIVSSFWDEDHEHAVQVAINRKLLTGSFYTQPAYIDITGLSYEDVFRMLGASGDPDVYVER